MEKNQIAAWCDIWKKCSLFEYGMNCPQESLFYKKYKEY